MLVERRQGRKGKMSPEEATLPGEPKGQHVTPSPLRGEGAQAPDLALWQVLDHDGKLIGSPPQAPDIAPEKLKHLYRHMLQLRLLDERMMILQRQGRVGFYGACTGQEA